MKPYSAHSLKWFEANIQTRKSNLCVITFVFKNNKSALDIISLYINARGYSQIEHN